MLFSLKKKRKPFKTQQKIYEKGLSRKIVRFVVSIDKSLQHVCKDHMKLTSSIRHPTLVRVLSYITELCRHRHK